jgi:NADPH:quinone reductase-like Zn-dependent oxidoreductase
MQQEKLTIASTMRVACVHTSGANHFNIDTMPTPTPEPGQLLIKVESAGVNFSDVKRRRGDAYPFPTAFPYIPGSEIAGTVVAHGPGVEAPPLGTRVFALAGANGVGGYAQYAVAYAPTAIPMPDVLDFDTASILLVAGTTAKVMLTQTARLQPGESILIPAATGGGGSFALQIAKQIGAGLIIAAVGQAQKAEAARTLGAHAVVVYSDPTWPQQVRQLTGGKGVDVALEATGGSMVEETQKTLAAFGRLVVFGAATGVDGYLPPAVQQAWLYAPAPNQMITGFNIGSWFSERPMVAAQALMELITDALSGRIQLPPITTLPLDQAAAAHQLLEERRVQGKLVLKPWA